MNLQWILASLFAVALIVGAVGSLSRSMLKNSLRLGATVLSFLVAFILQVCGVFQGAVESILEVIDLASMLPEELGSIGALIPSLASLLVSPSLFISVFLIVLWICQIVIHFVLKSVEKKEIARAQELSEAVAAVAAPEGEAATDSETSPEAAKVVEDEPVQPEVKEEPPKKPKKLKNPLYPECAWRRAISVCTSVVSAVLIFAVLLMPMSYVMGLLGEAADALDGSDSTDSQVQEMVSVLDEYIIAPYEDSFVAKFYSALALTSLTDYTVRAGGKIVLDSGKVAYADDTIRNIASNGLLAASQMMSEGSKCAEVERSVNALLTDPVIASVAADMLIDMFADMELEEADDDDITAELVNTFIEHYKNASKETVESDLGSLGAVVGVLAQKKIIYNAMNGEETDFSSMLEDSDTLASIVSAISGLSACAPTIESAFKLGVNMLGDTLEIPKNDAEAYDALIGNLLDALNGEAVGAMHTWKFSNAKLESFVRSCAASGKKVTSSENKNHEGYQSFVTYLAAWQEIQGVLGHSSEDRSYGYLTVGIGDKVYMYDSNDRRIYEVADVGSAEYSEKFAKKVSPLEDLIKYLAVNSTSNMTEAKLVSLLSDYAHSSDDPTCVAVAERLASRDGFVSRAATVDGMLAATEFEDWTAEEMERDSDLCVEIIVNLLEMMNALGESGNTNGGEYDIDALIGQFVTLGETMDYMGRTSCISKLPPLLLEGLVGNETFSQYLPAYVAYEFNDLVASGELTYTEAMNDLAATVRTLLNGFGGAIND